MFFEKCKKNSVYIIWFCFACCMGLIAAYLSSTLAFDDLAYRHNFIMNMQKNGGLIKALLAVATNADILADSGDFRTYGISRLIHTIIQLAFGDKASVYQFIIVASHILSGIIVYKILEKMIGTNNRAVYFAVAAYILSPFARVQSFHHWSYLMLPMYFLLLYINFELKTVLEIKQDNILSIFRGVFFIWLVVFTGEYTLVVLAFTLLLFITYGIIKNKKHIIKKYIIHLFLEVTLFLGWYYIYKHFIDRSTTSRFSIGEPIWLVGIKDFIISGVMATRHFLYMNNPYQQIFPSELNINIFKSFSSVIAILVILVIVTFLLLFMYITRKKIIYKQDIKIPSGIVLSVILFSLSSMGIYFGMNIFSHVGIHPIRYYYVPLTLIAVSVMLVINNIFKNKILLILSSTVLVIFILYNVVWYSCFLPDNKKINNEVEEHIHKAVDMGKTSIVLFNGGYPHGEIMIERHGYRADSAFETAWTVDCYLVSNYNFRNIVFMERDEEIKDNNDGTISIFNHKTNVVETLSKKDVFFMGTVDIPIDSGKFRNVQRAYYYSYEDYKNSPAYSGFSMYSSAVGSMMNSRIISGCPLLIIDAGAETNPAPGSVIDKIYSNSSKTTGINYGILPGNIGTGMIEDNIFLMTKNIGSLFKTNRYGFDRFSYKFSNLPEKDKLAIVIDGYEFWHNEPGKRVFDIKVETDVNTFTLKDVDMYTLSYNRNSIYGKSNFRLSINLPKTKNANITFINKEGYDIATIQGIGIVQR